MEFHVQLNTDITFFGTSNPGQAEVAIIYRPIRMQDVMIRAGPVSKFFFFSLKFPLPFFHQSSFFFVKFTIVCSKDIDSYIRSRLRVVQFNRFTCGQGEVTDGIYRMTINIATFVANDE